MFIDDKEIKKGKLTQLDLKVANLPNKTPINLRIFIYRAENDGPTLLLTAGIHGDELNGVEVLRRMIYEKNFKPENGNIIVIPVINQFSFLEKKRELPDGRDLNRCFPGSPNGPLANQLAHVMTTKILPLVDYGIDFHTGSGGRTNAPQLRYNKDEIGEKKLVEMFTPSFALHSSSRANSFRAYANHLGKCLVTYEAGEALRFERDCINEGIFGILNVLDGLGIQTNPLKARVNKTIYCESSTWLRASHAGLFKNSVNLGSKVKKGDVLGFISDPFGDFSIKIKAQKNSYVIGLSNNPIVYKGDALYHLGVD